MKTPTKVALTYLAETMVESGSYITLRGTANFIEWALRLHKKSGSYVTPQTIRAHEQDLEQMCQAAMLKRYPIKKDIVVPKQFDDDVDNDFYDEEDEEDDADISLYDEYGMEVDDSSLMNIAFAKIKRMMSGNKPSKMIAPVKEYNMFYEGEDGLTWLKGRFKNQPVGTPGMRYVNNAGITVTERTHANYMLGQTPNSYTNDDIDVLTKVATGTYE
jgi:hypothetical protein